MDLGKDFLTAFGLVGVPLMTVVGVLIFVLMKLLPANIEGRQKDLAAFINSLRENEENHKKERDARDEICRLERAADKVTFIEALHQVQVAQSLSQEKTEKRRDKEMDAIITRLEQLDQHLEAMGTEFESLRGDIRGRDPKNAV